MSVNRDLAAHLRYLETLGVSGFSRDAAWRTRPAEATIQPLTSPTQTTGMISTPPGAAATVGADTASSPTVSAVTAPERRLEVVRADLGECTRCKLHAGRTHLVFGVGNPAARLMFIGEGPGADEDEQGEPFVGRAGQLLTQIIKAMGFARQDVYIANVVKCRPPGNRNPEPDEIAQCSPFLQAQIAAILPKATISRGATSSIWRSRNGAHAELSSGVGLRFPGGRHFTTLAI